MTLRLGTRASLLARTQSGFVADALTAATGLPCELVPIRSEGDDPRVSLDAPPVSYTHLTLPTNREV